MKKSLLLSSIILCATGTFAADQYSVAVDAQDDAIEKIEFQALAEAKVAEADLIFQSFDLNSDGYINLEEAGVKKSLADQFIDLDTNEDSLLSEMEFSNRTEPSN